jgi:hypothetical protein
MERNNVSLPIFTQRVAAARVAPPLNALGTCLVGLLLAAPALGGQDAKGTAQATPPPAERPATASSSASTRTQVLQGPADKGRRAPLVTAQPVCLDFIEDQATGNCVKASSVPTFGQLLPYSGINNLMNAAGAFAGGGESNQATGTWSTVGGGFNNVVAGYQGTIAGGKDNTAAFTNCTVGGGELNSALSGGATVAGGANNQASGAASTIAGGQSNKAFGDRSAVPGGQANSALGGWSFAAGRRAKANHDGAFVWGDSNNVDKPSSATDEFNVYASGGVRLFTDSGATTGAVLAAGSGTWSMLSDRDAKENVEPVDSRSVLEGVLAMPLATWNYKQQGDSVRHLGPMAQDFHQAFGLGVSDKMIDSVDPDGVALAAIQGLNAKLQAELAELRAEKDADIDELLARLERLEAAQR